MSLSFVLFFFFSDAVFLYVVSGTLASVLTPMLLAWSRLSLSESLCVSLLWLFYFHSGVGFFVCFVFCFFFVCLLLLLGFFLFFLFCFFLGGGSLFLPAFLTLLSLC